MQPYPRTRLPDMNFGGAFPKEKTRPRVAGGGSILRVEWVRELSFEKKGGLDDTARLERARLALVDLTGEPYCASFSLDGDTLVVTHAGGPLDTTIERDVAHASKNFGGGRVRLVGIRDPEFRRRFIADSSLGPCDIPFLRRVLRSNNGSLDVDEYALLPEEKAEIAARFGSGDPGAQLFARLVEKPSTLVDKIAAADSLAKLGVFAPYVTQALALLAKRYSERALEDVHLRYNGHALFSVAPLAWAATRAFPTKSFTLLASKYSGSRESGNLVDFLLREQDRLLDWGTSDAERLEHADGLFRRALTTPIFPGRLVPTERFIWEKAANLLDDTALSPEAIARGVHRFIIHNADDQKEAERHRGFFGVALSSSKIKALEARYIGELYALLGARMVRTEWQDKVGNCEVRIVGAGLLGMSVADAHVRMGFPKARILILDSSVEARARAEALGFCTADLETAPETKLRTVCFIATGRPCLDGRTVRCLGPQSITFGLNSGGAVVVDREDTEAPLDVISSFVRGHEWPVDTGRGEALSFRDRKLTVRSEEGTLQSIYVVADFMPANLLHEQWIDRFHATGMAVLAASLQLAEQKEAKVAPLDPEIDAGMVRLAHELGHVELRPLDPRYDESIEDLEGDLEDGFHPSLIPLAAEAID